MAEKNKGGRPLKFKTKEELDEKIAAYFEWCDPHVSKRDVLVHPWKTDEKGKKVRDKESPKVIENEQYITEQQPYTITGLAIYLGTSRETLREYKGRKGYVDSIKAALLKCEHYAETSLYMGRNTTGAIFNLKNNYNWSDESKVENTGGITITTRKATSRDGN